MPIMFSTNPGVRVECTACRAAGLETAKWFDLDELTVYVDEEELCADLCIQDDIEDDADLHCSISVLEMRDIPACAVADDLSFDFMLTLANGYVSLEDWDNFEIACIWANAMHAEVDDFDSALVATADSFTDFAMDLANERMREHSVPDWVRYHFDYSSYAADLEHNYTVIEYNGQAWIFN